MLKTLLRTLVFLSLAGLISAGLYFYSQTASAQNFAAGPGRPGEIGGQFQAPAAGLDGAGMHRERGEGGEGASLLGGLPEVFKNLVIIALIVAIVNGVQALGVFKKKGASDPQPLSPEC